LAQALVEWNHGRVRQMYKEQLASLEAQFNTASESIRKLQAQDPNNADLSNLNTIRSGLLRDIQLMRGIASTVKGNLKILNPALDTTLVGLRPRLRGALAGAIALVSLTLLWLVIQTWRQVRNAPA
jgi:type II secretory pathway component PulM